jgi:hypothetical protein
MLFSTHEHHDRPPRRSCAPVDPVVAKPGFVVRTADPTVQMYGPLKVAFDHFNAELFNNALPPCVLTLRAKGDEHGLYYPGKFVTLDGAAPIDEIALNPARFSTQSQRETASTLVREMEHCWQKHDGTPSRSEYHNKEWAAKMRSIGLVPSDTGLVGGKETGDRMSHYILDDGPYDLSFKRLLASGWQLDLGEVEIAVENSKPKKREGFKCEFCDMTAEARASAQIACVTCMIAERPDLAEFLQRFQFKLVERGGAERAFACSNTSRSSSLPIWIENRLETAPRYISRRDLAALHRELLAPLSPRTLEVWPLVWRRVGGYAVTNTRDAMEFAWRRFESAPEYRVSGTTKETA